MAKSPRKRPPVRKKSARVSRKAPAKAIKKTDKRGTPKGKGTIRTKGGGKIGNPPHQPSAENRRIVETHAAVGTPHWAIAAELAISEDTLERHYRKELDLGLIRMNARIGSGIAKKALAGDSDMEKFWMARRGGPAWANKQQTELSGPAGAPIKLQSSPDLDLGKLSRAELKALKRLREKASANDEPPLD